MKFHATGAGQAVVQLDVNYGVDYEPHKDIPPKVSFQYVVELFLRKKILFEFWKIYFQYSQISFHEWNECIKKSTFEKKH